MFEQDYKNAMEKISPNADTRDRVLERIILRWENSQALCGVFCKKPGTDRTVS